MKKEIGDIIIYFPKDKMNCTVAIDIVAKAAKVFPYNTICRQTFTDYTRKKAYDIALYQNGSTLVAEIQEQNTNQENQTK